MANGDGDGRQRHQQQFLKAVFKEMLSSGTLTSPAKLAKVLDTVGKAMTIDTGGISIGDLIYAMRRITVSGMTTIKTNDGQYDSVNVPGIGACEQLSDASLQLLQSVRQDTVATFIAQHPEWAAGG